MTGRRLRVLSWHPQLGHPGHEIAGFDGAQSFVDAGMAEWVDGDLTGSVALETGEAVLPVETAVTRPSARVRAKPRDRPLEPSGS